MNYNYTNGRLRNLWVMESRTKSIDDQGGNETKIPYSKTKPIIWLPFEVKSVLQSRPVKVL